MDGAQPVVGYTIAVGLSALATYFAWQQALLLHGLHAQTDLSTEERTYLRRQAWLRLACCGLTLVLAVMVAATFAFGLELRVAQLGDALQAQKQRGEDVVLDAEQRALRRVYTVFWLIFLLILLATVVLAGVDIVAIRRFRARQLSQLDAARRAEVEKQVARLRSQRNGHC